MVIRFTAISVAALLLVVVMVMRQEDSVSPSDRGRSHIPLSVGTTSVFAEVADTSEKRKNGLSGRASLKREEGMLFMFDSADYYGFWMRDMLFSIDVIWIGDDKRIVDITEYASPDSYPRLFKPKAPARYVLEVPAGAARTSGWSEGLLVQW